MKIKNTPSSRRGRAIQKKETPLIISEKNQKVKQRSASAHGQRPALPDIGTNNRPLKTSANLRAICKFNNWSTRYNLMTGEPEVADSDGKRLGGSEAGQRSKLVDACQSSGVPDGVLDEHLIALCEGQQYHPVREWLESGAPWDGEPRLEKALATLNASDPIFARKVLYPWLVSCIAALYEPRFISKLVPVLTGPQSYRKSAWINRMASVLPGSTLDCSINPDKTDDVRRAVTVWIAELAEFESTSKHEAGILKAFLTRENDCFRLPYARCMTNKKRQTTFIATVNGTDFLKDSTGNSRFAVIELAAVADVDQLNAILGWDWNEGRLRHKDPEQLRQFWLEVKQLYDTGSSWFLDENTSAQAAKLNDAHTDKGPLYDVVIDHLLTRPLPATEWFSPSEICRRYGVNANLASRWGKELKLLASEGKIMSKKGRSNQTLYQFCLVAPVDA